MHFCISDYLESSYVVRAKGSHCTTHPALSEIIFSVRLAMGFG